MQDWLRDFDAFAWPITHFKLGPVHPGFLFGLNDALAVIKKNSGPKRTVGGHSLGAARASLAAGLLKLDGEPPLRRVVFGEPRPGFAKLREIIADIPGASYCNGNGGQHDIVTDVPLAIGFEHYMHPTPLVGVCAPPSPDDLWGPLAWHHEELYAAALAAESTNKTESSIV